MHFTQHILICTISLAVATPMARPQTNSTRAETLGALVAEALAHNAELKSFEAEVEAAKGQRTQAGFFRNPEISIEIGAREIRDSGNSVQGRGTTFSVAAMQTFEFPGKGTLRKAIAARTIWIAELGLEQFRLSLAGQVHLLAREYLAAEAEAAAAEVVQARSRALAEQILAGADFGVRPRIEARLIQASLIELGSLIREVSLKREETRLQINALLGRPRDFPLRLVGNLAPPPTLRAGESALVAAAQSGNPMLRIRQGELDRSVREVSAARLDIAPDFSIGPFFSREVAGDTEQNLGGAITASVPLWDWNIGNIQTAKARRAAAEALRVKAERDIEAQVLSRLRALILAQHQLAHIPSGTLDGIREAASLAETQFRNGSVGAQLYLDAQTASLNSLRSLHASVLDAWRAYLDLNLLTGGFLNVPAKK